ncbi:MAG: glycosyltransferase [Acidobacteria bacterium]|nr:MAG: glycosyltransferase [Acidobacteriota bacterium]
MAREVLTRLSESLDITVLTSCARDYVSWSNYYPPGETTEDGIRLVRFPVKMQRPVRAFNLLSRLVLQRRLAFVRPPLWLERLWLRWQGPYCPDLIAYLKRHRDDFEAFLFYTYLYYPAARGLREVAGKSILIPTAHDERPIYLQSFRRLFRLSRALIYLTPEEQSFANQLFGTREKPQRVASMRIRTMDDRDEAIPAPSDVREFLEGHRISQPYLLYLGRIDPAKGVDTMFRFFLRYVREGKRGELLVLAGDKQAEIPESASVRYLGFLSEQEKRTAILGSRALVLLSPYESFSISVLEVLGLGRPVIVTSESAVLKGHVERSRAGFAVSSYDEFRVAADYVLAAQDDDLGRLGIRYVKENFSWEKVEKAYLELIDGISS